MFNGGYYNPYMYSSFNPGSYGMGAAGAARMGTSGSGIRGLLGKFNWSSFLSSAGKTLNVVNQAIPVFYQVRPIINNAKTMFRVVGAVRDSDKPKKTRVNNNYSNNQASTVNNPTTNTPSESYTDKGKKTDNSPTFFI